MKNKIIKLGIMLNIPLVPVLIVSCAEKNDFEKKEVVDKTPKQIKDIFKDIEITNSRKYGTIIDSPEINTGRFYSDDFDKINPGGSAVFSWKTRLLSKELENIFKLHFNTKDLVFKIYNKSSKINGEGIFHYGNNDKILDITKKTRISKKYQTILTITKDKKVFTKNIYFSIRFKYAEIQLLKI